MVMLLTKFVYFDNLNLADANDTSASTGVEIDDCYELTIDFGSEMRNNSMKIFMKNDPIDVFSDGTIRHRWVNKDGDSVFKAVKTARGAVIEEEIINVYAHHTELDPTIDVEASNYLLFQGVINKGKIPFKNNSNAIELSCKDRSAILLDKLTIPQAYRPDDTNAPDGTGWRSPSIIQNLIRNCVDQEGTNALKYDGSGNLVSNGIYLIDARLFSDGVVDSGTTTSASTRTLIETGQNFETTVDVGDWVRNTTDDTYAYVESVDSDTQLTLSKDIMASGDEYQISDGFIQDSRDNGTDFPVMSFSQINKPVLEGLKNLSTTEKTNTDTEISGTPIMKRSMRFFIDNKNRFHWYYPSNTAEWIFVVGQTSAQSPDTSYHRLYEVTPGTFTEDNINFIIFKAGEDMNGVQVKYYARAPFSGTPNIKDSLREFPRIARTMKWEDADRGNIVKNQFDDYNYPVSYDALPSGDDYPAWDSIRSSVPTDDDEYNDAFIAEARKRGIAECKGIFQEVANPRWKGKAQVRGEDVGVGDLIDFTSKAHGINNIKVRVTQVTHSITSKTGWITTINFEEDENELEVA